MAMDLHCAQHRLLPAQALASAPCSTISCWWPHAIMSFRHAIARLIDTPGDVPMIKRTRLFSVLLLLATANPATRKRRGPPPALQRATGPASAQAGKGRLLIFASETAAAEAAALEQSKGKSKDVMQVDANPFAATQTTVAAREVGLLKPGQTTSVDGDSVVFPAPFSQLPPGDYYVQAVLDADHSYAYTGPPCGRPGQQGGQVASALGGRALAPARHHLASQRPVGPAPIGQCRCTRRIEGGARACASDRYPQRADERVLGPPHFLARLGADAARLREIRRRTLPHRVRDERLRLQPRRPGTPAGRHLRHDGQGRDAAHDLGVPRPRQRHRYPRVCRLGQQRSLGRGTDARIDPPAGKILSHGWPRQWPLLDGTFLGRLVDLVAADALSDPVRRHLVHLARPVRFP